jgi:dTDP-4-amino-4,6-dideoxygalactose transaminase
MSDVAIPLSEPSITGNAASYLEECLRTNYVSSIGPFVARFEREFAGSVGVSDAVACASGTAALHVAFRALGIGPGDEVLVPTLTFIASANAAAYLGARVTLVDSERETWNLDPAIVAEEIDRRVRTGERLPRAIEVVHLLGHPADIEALVVLAQEHDILLVEDAAEALGAAYRGGALDRRAVGSIGRIGCFSFNGNKVITTGGGGMLVSDDPAIARHARHLTTQARLPGLAYQHDEVGYNYRLSNLAAALGVAQLEVLSMFLETKRAIARRYDDAFEGRAEVTPAPRATWAYPSGWLYSIRLADPSTAEQVLADLNGVGIGARPMWTPLHLTGPYRDAQVVGGGHVAEAIASTVVSLPSSVTLTETDQSRVIGAVLDSLAS